MRTHARDLVETGLGWAALFVVGAGLSGCSLVAGWLAAGNDSAASVSLSADEPADGARELKVTLRPGVSLLQAAERAPRAVAVLHGAARRLSGGRGDWSVLDGSYLHAVSSGLLSEGLLLPGPLGALEIRTIAPEPPVLATPPPDRHQEAEPQADADCSGARRLSELVGAYRAGPRLLLLRADGQFLLVDGAVPRSGHRPEHRTEHRTGHRTGHHTDPVPGPTGRFAVHCQALVLTAEAAPPARLMPLAHDGWLDDRGSAFFPLSEPAHGDVP